METKNYIDLEVIRAKGLSSNPELVEKFVQKAYLLEREVLDSYQQMITEEAQSMFAVLGGSLDGPANHWDQLSPERQEWYLRAAQRHFIEDFYDNNIDDLFI
jgi:hypothetical protein